MKRAISVLLIAAMLLSLQGFLSGCGGTQPTGSDPAPQTAGAADTQPRSSAGSQSEESVDTETTAESAPQSTEADDSEGYLEDYRQFWEILEQDYPYLPYLASRGYDLDGIRSRYASRLQYVNNPTAFLTLLSDVCRELDNFAHLHVFTPEWYELYYATFVNNPQMSEFPEYRAFREILTDPTLSALYRPSSGDYRQQQAESLPESTYSYYADCDALYLSLPTFRDETVERDRDILTEALKQYPDVKHIIFDIRENSGGNDRYWKDNLVTPLGGDPYEDRAYLFYRDTPRLSPYFAAYASAPVTELTELPEWVADLKLDRYFCLEGANPGLSAEAEALPGRSARRWLLVSPVVYSSAEMFAAFCKNTGWATLVGKTTGGDGIGTDPVLMKLDHTGLLFRFSAAVGENESTGLPSAYGGTVPDYETDSALSECLRIIRGE